MEQFGSIAHVFTTYQSRHEKDGKPFARGINSFQLVKLGNRWWVASIMWDTERPDVPIPGTYLGRLSTGRDGRPWAVGGGHGGGR